MSQPTVTEAVKAFLKASTHPDLAALYNSGMEVQCNCAQDGGNRIGTENYRGRTSHAYTDGAQVWKSFRVPWKSFSTPEYIDSEIKYDLAEHAEGIGMTGWNWEHRISKWVGYDFDAISGHSTRNSSKLTGPELEAVKNTACDLPWVTVRRSTSGNGLHLYVFLPDIPTANHSEHAALSRAILGKMSAVTGFDFDSKVDVCGSVLWTWHRKMSESNRGLELIKQGGILKEIPLNWKDHIEVIKGKRKKSPPKYIEEKEISDFEQMTGQRPHVKLDDQHRKLLDYLNEAHAQWFWDQDHHMLVCHTFDLKNAHKKLELRGIFDTVAAGRDQGADHNAFMFPLERPTGAWAVRRYSPGIQETSNWDQDSSGFTRCYYNREPTLDIASQTFGGMEDEKGNFEFSSAEPAIQVAETLGVSINLPKWTFGRRTQLKQHKDGRLVIYIAREDSDNPAEMPSWRPDKGWWKRLFNANLQQPGEPEILSYDTVIRHIRTVTSENLGWVLRAGGKWCDESYTNIRLALKALDLNDHKIDQIMGKGVFEGWTIVNEPFQDEYLGQRKWNRNAAQFRFSPQSEGPFRYPTWQAIMNHCGRGLDAAVAEDGWCKANNIASGADYLKIWIASLFQFPKEPLPYLFLYSKEERTGKTTFHEALSLLLTDGYKKADAAVISSSGFNGELENGILCAIEELNLQKNIGSRNRIKDWVTAKTILIHHKGRTPYQVENTVHFVQTGNNHSECPIFAGDTRITMIHVPPFELSEMIPTKQMRAQLEQEAPHFLGEILKTEIPPSNDRLNVPVVDTDIKIQTSQINRSSLEIFLDEMLYNVPGAMILYSDLYIKFQEWLDPSEVHNWTKIKFGRELPIKYPKGRVMAKNAQFYVGNLSFTDSGNKDSPRLILRDGKLVI